MEQLQLKASDRGYGLELPPILDMAVAGSLKVCLLEAVALAKPLVIDAAQVERLSTPCIQVLVAAGTALQEAGIGFSLHRPSEAFADAFNDLGLFSVLMRWDITA